MLMSYHLLVTPIIAWCLLTFSSNLHYPLLQLFIEQSTIQKIGTRDFWRTANSVLNNNKSAIRPLFQGPIVVSSPKDKADVFAQQFAANSTLEDNRRSPPDFPLRTPTSIKLPVITPRKVAGITVNHIKLLARTEYRWLS